MFISPAEVLNILEHYKYFLIFPIAIVEGPIIIIITGFLVFLGYLNIYAALPVLVVADVIGDSMYYLVGKYWKRSIFIKRIASFLGYNEKSEIFLEEHFKKHKGKTFLLAKISHGIGGAVQVSSGIAGVKYTEFLKYSILGTVPKATILLVVGYYAGSYYLKIDNILNYIATITLTAVVLVVLYLLLARYIKKFLFQKEV